MDQHAHPLRQAFRLGDKIVALNPASKRWTRRGVIVEISNDGRSVRFCKGGRTYLRNRKFVKAAPGIR